MIEIRKTGRPVTPEDIASIEEAIDCALPATYRAFLLAFNGGRPRPDLIDIADAHFKGTDVKVFLGIDRHIDSENILWALDILEGCKENKLLPIAGDSCGRTFMLALTPDEYGQVYYFDFAEIPPHPYFVAHDFNEFLNKIREATPDELADGDAG